MGLFGDIGKFFSGIPKKVVQTVTNPTKLVNTILTGGVSLVSKDVDKLFSAATSNLFNPAVFASVFPPAAPSVQVASQLVSSFGPQREFRTTGAQPMALNIGGILQGVSGIFGGNQNPVFQNISNIAGLASQFVPTPSSPQTSLAVLPPAARAAPMMPAMRAAGAMIGRSFFQRFPNLGVALQQLRDRGLRVKRSQLHSLLRRFGPEVLITGGLLTAAAVNELMLAGPGHRRMNPCNAKALRRSVRRIKSFHNLCKDTDIIKSRTRRKCA